MAEENDSDDGGRDSPNGNARPDLASLPACSLSFHKLPSRAAQESGAGFIDYLSPRCAKMAQRTARNE